MAGHDPENRQGLVYYTCSTYRRKSKTACTKHTIREDRLRTLTAQALGVAAEDLTGGCSLPGWRRFVSRRAGEIAVHPLQTGRRIVNINLTIRWF